MGCNCKQKTEEQKPKAIQVNGVTEIMNQPQFTIEEIQRVENWLNSTNKTKEETDYSLEFNFRHFGEPPMGYCDVSCQTRIRRRLEHLKLKLQKYGTR